MSPWSRSRRTESTASATQGLQSGLFHAQGVKPRSAGAAAKPAGTKRKVAQSTRGRQGCRRPGS